MILLFTGAAFIMMRFFTTTNECTVLASGCSRLRIAFCSKWIETKERPTQIGSITISDSTFLDNGETVKTCTIIGGKPKKGDCAVPSKEECEEAFNTTIS